MTLNFTARSSSIPPILAGQALFWYGVMVHKTGWRPPSDAGRNQPSSRTPSAILTAISRQAGVAAFDGGVTNPNQSAHTTAAAPAPLHPHRRLPEVRIPDNFAASQPVTFPAESDR